MHAFNPSTWEAEAGESLSKKPTWCTAQVLGQSGLHWETLSRKTKQTNKQISQKTQCVGKWFVIYHLNTWEGGARGFLSAHSYPGLYNEFWASLGYRVRLYLKNDSYRVVVAHTFNSSSWEERLAVLHEFEASLIYRVSSRTASTVTQRNPALKNQNK